MSVRVARSRQLVAHGFAVAAVACVMQISRQALYRTPTPRRPPQRRPPVDVVERAIVEVAGDNQTDGYRMVAALVGQKLRVPVNRKRVSRDCGGWGRRSSPRSGESLMYSRRLRASIA